MALYFDADAWSTYFKARADSLNLAWTLAKGAYKSFRQVRVDLQLPILDDGDASAWSQTLAQDAADLQAIVNLLLKVASDVISGVRGVAWNTDKQDFYIEKLPTDEIRIVVTDSPQDTGRLTLVSTKTGELVHAQNQVSAPPDLSLYVASLRTFVLAEAACFTLRSYAEQRTLETLGAYRQKLVNEGVQNKEEQGKLLVHAIEDSSKGVYDAASSRLTPSKVSGGSSEWSNTEKILLISAMATVVSVSIQVFKARSGKA